MSKKNYTVLTPVDHDNERVEPGATIALDDAHAEPLLIVKAIAISSASVVLTEPTDAADRLAAITGAIGQLDPNNAELFLKDGKPKTEAVSAITGWPITAKERDAAWSAMQAS